MTSPADQPQLILCNCPSNKVATAIAKRLVTERLAACVNCLPGVRSVYRWHDNVEEADEIMLLIKTQSSRYPAVEQAIAAAHPFDVPEIIAIDISNGLPAYLQWLAESL